MEQQELSKAQTDLSRRTVSLTMRMSHTEVLDTLGTPPNWVFLPGDSGDWALPEGVFLELTWDNGPCPPVSADFDAEGKLTGWNGGAPTDHTCDAKVTAMLVPPRGQYGCKGTGTATLLRVSLISQALSSLWTLSIPPTARLIDAGYNVCERL
jgi:hypothetical protein